MSSAAGEASLPVAVARVLPVLALLFLMSFLDRTNMSVSLAATLLSYHTDTLLQR